MSTHDRASGRAPKREPVRRHVDEVVRWLFEPLLRPRPTTSSWRVVSWDAEQGPCITLERRGAVLLFELETRDESRAAWARTERFNVHVRRMFEEGTPLRAGDRRLADAVVELIRRREPHLPAVPRPPTGARSARRDLLVDRVLIPEGRGHYYINPYVGCTIGCPFCYVGPRADLARSLEGLPQIPWGRYVDVKVNAPEVLRRELGEHAPGPVRMSPILTAPYQPVERTARVTRRCLEVMVGTGFAPVILTRAARVTEDIDVLRRFERAAVGVSLPSDDDHMRQLFEPGADPIEARLEALEALHAAGIPTFVVVQPMLPMDVDRVLQRLAPLVRAARVDRMHFLDTMRPTYEAHGLEWAMEDAFFAETGRRLLDGFRDRGVVVDELDDLIGLIGRVGRVGRVGRAH